MKKIFLICFCFISISLFSENPKYYLKSTVGLIAGKETYKGVSTNIGIGYDPLNYVGVEFFISNWYRYANDSSSDTNTGLSLALHLYPINFMGNAIDLFAGYGYNTNYWRYNHGGIGRHLYLAPLFGAGYYHSFNALDLGLTYQKQYFKGLREDQNTQFLLSIKKRF